MNIAKKQITIEKELGRFYTPDYMVKIILDLSGYKGDGILKKHVIDNSCGDGAFLREIVDRYCKKAKKAGYSHQEISKDLATFIHGIEIEPTELEKCKKNADQIAQRHGITGIHWDFICADALKVNTYDQKMDFVVGNPPYVRVHNLGNSFENIKTFSFAQSGMTDLFIVFYEIGIRMLGKNGVLGYITPSSFFNSLAGAHMRKTFIKENLIKKVVNLRHLQVFKATTYTTIIILKKNKKSDQTDYYLFDENRQLPYYVDTLSPKDYFIANNFYFSTKKELYTLRKIYDNVNRCDVYVKNGYATLCDKVFIHDYDFDSDYIIPVIKASRGLKQKIFYPYDRQAQIIDEATIRQDQQMYTYLSGSKERLLNRSSDKIAKQYWYAYGRTQAIGDTYKNKLSINNLLRTENDFKFESAPAGTGVYSGLYIVSDSIDIEKIKSILKSHEFLTYITLLGKYKSGGYYTYSSKDVKRYLDYALTKAKENTI